MSSTKTSGASRAAASTAARPSRTVSTTSNSGSRSSSFDLEERLVIVGQQYTGPAHRSLPSALGA